MIITWITGAGRCGTHLLAGLLDGTKDFVVLPAELRITKIWEKARRCALWLRYDCARIQSKLKI